MRLERDGSLRNARSGGTGFILIATIMLLFRDAFRHLDRPFRRTTIWRGLWRVSGIRDEVLGWISMLPIGRRFMSGALDLKGAKFTAAMR